MLPTTLNIPQKSQPKKYPDFSGYGWIIIICGFLLYLIVDGIAYNLGLINSAWLAEFQQSETATSWIGSIFYSVPLLSAPITAQLIENFGCKMITIVCGIISTFGFIVSSFCGSIEQLYVSVGLIAGFGVSAAYVVGILSAERWFEKHRTLAIGIVSSGTGFGTFVIAPITQRLLDAFGWRKTMYFLASLNVLMSIVGCFINDPPWMTGEFEDEKNGTENFGYCEEFEVNYGTWKRKQSIESVNSKRNERIVDKSLNYQKTDDFHPRTNANDIENDSEYFKRVNMSKNDVKYTNIVNEERNDVQTELKQQMTKTPSANTDKLQIKMDDQINYKNCKDVSHQNAFKNDSKPISENCEKPQIIVQNFQKKQFISDQSEKRVTSSDEHYIESENGKAHQSDSMYGTESQIMAQTCRESPKLSQELKEPSNFTGNSHETVKSPTELSTRNTSSTPHKPNTFSTVILFIKNKLKVVKKIFSHFSNRNFTLLAISTFAIYALYNVPMFFIVELLKNYGYTEAQCANYLSLIGFSLLIGMVTLGYIGDISGDQVKNVNALCVLICGIAECLLPTCAENSITFGICCVIFGFSFASAYVLIPKIAEMVVGIGEFATAIGLNFFVQGLALLFGIPFASTIYESIGSWKISFEICGAIIASGSIFAFLIRVKRD